MKTYIMTTAAVLALGAAVPANATSDKTWRGISNVGVGSLTAAALLTPTVQGDWKGLKQAGLSLAVSDGITFGLKSAIHSQRPDKSDFNSFPSGHTTVAFAAATTLHRRYGWKAGLPAYGVATLTGVSRKLSHRHRWVDVGTGALIGTASGWFFTDKLNENVQLVPWADTHGGGVSFAMRW